MSIDWDKPLETRDGREVRIYTTEGAFCHYPVIGERQSDNEHWVLERWATDGHILQNNGISDNDLVNVLEQHTVTINVYKSHGNLSFLHYDSRRIAEQLVQEGCIARIEVTFTEGEGL